MGKRTVEYLPILTMLCVIIGMIREMIMNAPYDFLNLKKT